MSQSTIFQPCGVGATVSWVYSIPRKLRSDMYQYFRGVKCLAKGHNMVEVGFDPRLLAPVSDTLPLSHCAPSGIYSESLVLVIRLDSFSKQI